jgi:hypothetical protein
MLRQKQKWGSGTRDTLTLLNGKLCLCIPLYRTTTYRLGFVPFLILNNQLLTSCQGGSNLLEYCLHQLKCCISLLPWFQKTKSIICSLLALWTLSLCSTRGWLIWLKLSTAYLTLFGSPLFCAWFQFNVQFKPLCSNLPHILKILFALFDLLYWFLLTLVV